MSDNPNRDMTDKLSSHGHSEQHKQQVKKGASKTHTPNEELRALVEEWREEAKTRTEGEQFFKGMRRAAGELEAVIDDE